MVTIRANHPLTSITRTPTTCTGGPWHNPYRRVVSNGANQPKKFSSIRPTIPGYILEVELEYPEELHDSHNLYPLASEKTSGRLRVVSPYQKNLIDKLTPIKTLIPNLRNKEKYVDHYSNLQLCLRVGMKITKIHRTLKFDQSPWMKNI